MHQLEQLIKARIAAGTSASRKTWEMWDMVGRACPSKWQLRAWMCCGLCHTSTSCVGWPRLLIDPMLLEKCGICLSLTHAVEMRIVDLSKPIAEWNNGLKTQNHRKNSSSLRQMSHKRRKHICSAGRVYVARRKICTFESLFGFQRSGNLDVQWGSHTY